MPTNQLTQLSTEELEKLLDDTVYLHETYILCEDRAEAKKAKKLAQSIRAELASRATSA